MNISDTSEVFINENSDYFLFIFYLEESFTFSKNNYDMKYSLDVLDVNKPRSEKKSHLFSRHQTVFECYKICLSTHLMEHPVFIDLLYRNSRYLHSWRNYTAALSHRVLSR